MKHPILVLLCLLAPLAAHAKEVRLSGRVVAERCDVERPAREGSFTVEYANDLLPAGAEVSVRYGFAGSNVFELRGERKRFHVYFDRAEVVPMRLVAPGKWSASFAPALESEGGDARYHAIDFTFGVTLADGRRFRDDGSALPHTTRFYQAKLATVACAAGENPPAERPLEIRRTGYGYYDSYY